MDMFLLYLWTCLEGIHVVLSLLSIIIVLFFIFGFMIADVMDLESEQVWKWYRRAAILLICITLAFVFIPSQKNAAILATAWVIKEASKTDTGQKIGSAAVDFIIESLATNEKK